MEKGAGLRIFSLLFFSVVVIGIGVACYFFFFFDNSPVKIAAGQNYPLEELRNGYYPGVGLDANSYCTFGAGYKTFTISFAGGSEQNFIVSKFNKRKGNVTAILRQIYDGEILTYKLSTNKNTIRISTTVKYPIVTHSEQIPDGGEFIPITEKTESRSMIVMIFSRKVTA